MASREANSQDLKTLKRSISALCGVFTKNVNSLTRLIDSASPGSPSLLITLIEEAQCSVGQAVTGRSQTSLEVDDTRTLWVRGLRRDVLRFHIVIVYSEVYTR